MFIPCDLQMVRSNEITAGLIIVKNYYCTLFFKIYIKAVFYYIKRDGNPVPRTAQNCFFLQ